MSAALVAMSAAAGSTAVADSTWRMISQTGEYALRIALHLGSRAPGTRISAADAAAELDVPAHYMARVLNELAHAGVMTSTRGPHGGFRLAVPPAQLTLADVIAQFDAVGAPPQCLLRSQRCGVGEPCIAHHEWHRVADGVRRFFKTTTIAELLDADAARAEATTPPADPEADRRNGSAPPPR